MAFDEINSKWIDGQQRFRRHDVGVLLGMLTDSFDLEEEIDNLRQQNAQLLEACKAALNWLNEFGEHAPVMFGGEGELAEQLRAAIAEAEGRS